MRYELFHDVLAEPILDWRRGYEQRRARRRWAAIGAGLIALAAVFAALGVWALVERGHARARANELYALNTHLTHTNRFLRHKRLTLANELKAKRTQQSKTLEQVQSVNESLRREVAALTGQRNALAAENQSLEQQNQALVSQLDRLNTENKSLVAEVNRLNSEDTRTQLKFESLQGTHKALVGDASVLKTERTDLSRQLRQLARENKRLAGTAKKLGFTPTTSPPRPKSAASPVTGSTPATTHRFPTPKEVSTYDALRKKVADLEQKLTSLESRAAQIRLLKNENNVLRQQQAALRKESATLETQRAKLRARKRKLVGTVAAAAHEHRRLGSQAQKAKSALRSDAHQVALEQRSISALQSRNNGQVDEIGRLQDQIRRARDKNTQLVDFLRSATKKLVQAVEAPPPDAKIAGLLAAEAFLVTPDDPDATAHPGAYNALWLSLNRLNPAAAAALIAPNASSGGKIGTTRSKVLKQKVCGLVVGPIPQSAWAKYVPGIQYPLAPLDNPCT